MPCKRIAVITGVSRVNGIGRGCCRAFLQAGYSVVGVDIRPLQEHLRDTVIKRYGGEFLFVQADLTQLADVQRVLQSVLMTFGKQIHVLINNAGIADPYLPQRQSGKLLYFNTVLAINLTAAYTMTEALLPIMVPGESSIVHISSTRALQSEPQCEAYAAAKAGLTGLTHAQAATLQHQVRVNCILPGWIDTADTLGDGLTSEDNEWHWAGRVGVAEDVAHMAVFLSDPQRAGFITGQQFVVDGGTSRRMHYPEATTSAEAQLLPHVQQVPATILSAPAGTATTSGGSGVFPPPGQGAASCWHHPYSPPPQPTHSQPIAPGNSSTP